MGRAETDPVVDAIYTAALRPEAWEQTLHRLTHPFGSEAANLEIYDRDNHLELFSGFGIDADQARAYEEHYVHVCPRHQALWRGQPGTVFGDAAIGTEQELDRNEFYADFLEPHGLRYFVAGVLQRDSTGTAVIAVQRSRGAGIFRDGEMAAFRRYVPHLQRAVEISRRVGAELARGRDLEASLEVHPSAVVLLSPDHRAVFVNRAARELLRAQKTVALIGGRLRARRAADQARLDALLESTTTGDPGQRTPVILGQPPRHASISLVAVALPSADALLPWTDPLPRARIMVTLKAPRSVELRPECLVGVAGLTRAEAGVALALVRGMSLRDYADEQELSILTVRGYMKLVREKLGCKSQAEVVQTLLGLFPA